MVQWYRMRADALRVRLLKSSPTRTALVPRRAFFVVRRRQLRCRSLGSVRRRRVGRRAPTRSVGRRDPRCVLSAWVSHRSTHPTSVFPSTQGTLPHEREPARVLCLARRGRPDRPPGRGHPRGQDPRPAVAQRPELPARGAGRGRPALRRRARSTSITPRAIRPARATTRTARRDPRHVGPARGEGLFADFHFNPKHALAEQLLWDAEHAPENVGFSHNVEARVRAPRRARSSSRRSRACRASTWWPIRRRPAGCSSSTLTTLPASLPHRRWPPPRSPS